jgi:hypothetical protein
MLLLLLAAIRHTKTRVSPSNVSKDSPALGSTVRSPTVASGLGGMDTPRSTPVAADSHRGLSTRRDPAEWQGMLREGLRLLRLPSCRTAHTCGLAMGCVDGRCDGCRYDSDCSSDEVCVLDHCLISQNVGCRRRKDCSLARMLCILSDYSSDSRGNVNIRSYCLDPEGTDPRPRAVNRPVSAVDAGSSTGENGPVGGPNELLMELLRERD